MERLTARRADNGLAYLKNVKQNEQEVDSPYPNTLKCILESFKRLAAYEDTGLEPEGITNLQEKYDAAIKALSGAILEQKEIPYWIPVSERLPEESGGDENGEVLIYKGGEKWITKVPWVKDEDATHWMPLPQPPKEEK